MKISTYQRMNIALKGKKHRFVMRYNFYIFIKAAKCRLYSPCVSCIQVMIVLG